LLLIESSSNSTDCSQYQVSHHTSKHSARRARQTKEWFHQAVGDLLQWVHEFPNRDEYLLWRHLW